MAENGAVVLLAESSPFLRGLMRGELEMAGHKVVEAATSDEALGRLEGCGAGVVLAAANLPPDGCNGLREAMRQHANLAGIPVMALAGAAEGGELDRESMLASIERLAQAVIRPVAEAETVVPAGPVEGQA